MNTIRAFAIGWRIRPECGTSHTRYFQEMERLVKACAVNFSADHPNLLVFPEHVNLPFLHLEEADSSQIPRRATELFYNTFGLLSRDYGCFIAACGDLLNEDGMIYNQSVCFDPTGLVIGTTSKVHLVDFEVSSGLRPGRLNAVSPFTIDGIRVGAAISLDAFIGSYISRLDGLGVQLVLQHDANDQLWAASALGSGRWQPEEWLYSVLGSIGPEHAHLRYNVCPMMVGRFGDIVFDGQTSITAKDEVSHPVPFTGVTHTGLPGRFLYCSTYDEDKPFSESIGWADLSF